MSPYITAQLVGFLGFLLLTCGPYFKNKDNNIKLDIVASSLLFLQWILLSQPGLAAINIMSITLSIGALTARKNKFIDSMLPLFYPVGLLVLLWFAKGTVIDLICIIGFFSLITSKKSKEIRTFRSYAILTAIAFTCSGILAGSIPAVIFSAIRASLHAYRLWELNKFQQTLPAYAATTSDLAHGTTPQPVSGQA